MLIDLIIYFIRRALENYRLRQVDDVVCLAVTIPCIIVATVCIGIFWALSGVFNKR